MNFLFAQADGQGLVLWFNGSQTGGQGGTTLKAFLPDTPLGVIPNLGPAVAHVDAQGNGLLAWHSAQPAIGTQPEDAQYLYTQTLTHFQPTGTAHQLGLFRPLSVSLDAAGNGWLLLSDERPTVFQGKTQPEIKPDILHIQARQITNYALQSQTHSLFELPYIIVDQGYLNNQGTGLVVWEDQGIGAGHRLLSRAFEDFKASDATQALTQLAKRHWLVEREGDGALSWVEYDAPNTPHALHFRLLQQGKLASTSQEIPLSDEMYEALSTNQFGLGLNTTGAGLLLWQQDGHPLMGQSIQGFAFVGHPLQLTSGSALRLKLSLDAQGNGLFTWVERRCEPINCTDTHLIQGRPVLRYQLQ